MHNPNEQHSIAYTRIIEVMQMPDAWFTNETFDDPEWSIKDTLTHYKRQFPIRFKLLDETNFRFDDTHLYFDDQQTLEAFLKSLPHSKFEIEEDSPTSKGNLVADFADILEITLMDYRETTHTATKTEVHKRLVDEGYISEDDIK
jgi:hypothetical protein